MRILSNRSRAEVIGRAQRIALDFKTQGSSPDPISTRLKFPQDDAEILARRADHISGPDLRSMIAAAAAETEVCSELADTRGEDLQAAGIVFAAVAAGSLLLGSHALVALPLLGGVSYLCTKAGERVFQRLEDAQDTHSALLSFAEAYSG